MVDIFAPPEGTPAVALTDEVRRIERLPRRFFDDEQLVAEMTEALKTPLGTMHLRKVQAQALFEIGTVGGLFGPMRVGAGKTLISLLAPTVAFAERPLLLVPASLVDKTKREERVLRHHWQLPEFVRIMSYEMLGRVQAEHALGSVVDGVRRGYWPDLIVADEAHKLKNPKAACTRRVRRYMTNNPATKFVAISGTITKRSIKDFAHLMRWCLKEDAPLPRWHDELEIWADAIDERKGQLRRADPGALRVFCSPVEDQMWDQGERRTAARLALRRRFTDTPGVVATKETPIDASLDIKAIEPVISPAIDEAFETLRNDFITPDGWPIADGLDMFRHARELALGFYYVWDPRPPAYWLTARSAWAAFARQTIGRSRTLDSELAVRNWVDATEDDEGLPLLEEWREVRDDFEPNTVARWVDDSALEASAAWGAKNVGIIWTEHRCFAERLSKLSGLPYYGRKGLDAKGRYIEDHGRGSLIASISSNGTGRNLQRWNRNLITSMPANGMQTEQLLGRTHRDGQLADAVLFEILVTCAEHVGAFEQALRDSRFVHDLNGSPQKMLDATIEFPGATDLAFRSGARWEKEL